MGDSHSFDDSEMRRQQSESAELTNEFDEQTRRVNRPMPLRVQLPPSPQPLLTSLQLSSHLHRMSLNKILNSNVSTEDLHIL
jgi:hypothetical protein